MSCLRSPMLIAISAFLSIVFCFAVLGYVYPPFTDAEIRASFVDTWEAHAVGTAAFLFLVLLATCFSVALAWGASGSVKRLAAVALVLGFADAALLVALHVSMTERTTALTGQTFGSFYGLF